MRRGPRLVAEREKNMDAPGFSASAHRARRCLARLLHRTHDGVVRIVESHARGAKQDLDVEAPFEKELRVRYRIDGALH